MRAYKCSFCEKVFYPQTMHEIIKLVWESEFDIWAPSFICPDCIDEVTKCLTIIKNRSEEAECNV